MVAAISKKELSLPSREIVSSIGLPSHKTTTESSWLTLFSQTATPFCFERSCLERNYLHDASPPSARHGENQISSAQLKIKPTGWVKVPHAVCMAKANLFTMAMTLRTPRPSPSFAPLSACFSFWAVRTPRQHCRL